MKLAKNLERLGTETAFSVLAEAKKLEAQGKEMIHLGLGQPDFMTPKHIMDAAKKSIAGFSTKLPVGLFGLIKIINLVLSVIEDKIFSGSNFKSFSFVKSYGTALAPV